MTRRTPFALTAGIALAMLATACANQTGGNDAPASPAARPVSAPLSHTDWKSCAAEPSVKEPAAATTDALALPLLDNFAAKSVVVCSWSTQRRPDGGTDLVATEEHADDVTGLLAALRLPDEPRITGDSPDDACFLDQPAVPWLTLLDGKGHWIQPGIPADACGKPRKEVRNAVAGLETTRISTHVVKELESALTAETGCEQQHADQIWMETSTGLTSHPSDEPLIFPSAAAPAHLCTYRVPAAEQRTGKPGGELISSRSLDAQRWTAIRREVETTGPALVCTTPASRFAMVPTPELYVELDGCHRALVTTDSGGNALRQATPALLALLTV
jgi:hypothetical protein